MDQLIAADPTRIGPYRLIARLGAGGMGLVYLGRSEGGRTVAVKVVQAEYAGHPEFRRRFAREVAAARRVGGSWTAAVLDADPDAAVPWVATQYIPGPDLTTVVAKDYGPLPEDSVHTLANRLALALQAVHEAGLIHRDLKPSNVLVTVDGPRVIDFGIARAMDSLAGDSLHTSTGMLIGSPGFMSPEQVRGLELTPASDVFCLGAVLVYAATGRLLFGATDTGLNAHLFRVAEEEADLTGVPDALLDLVRACLDKDRARRPSPREVAERTATDRAAEWLPGAVLAQLGRHAAELLDFAPASPAETAARIPAQASAGTPVAQLDPRVAAASHQPQSSTPALPPPPAYAPTASAQYGAGQGFGPPPGAPVTAWSATPLPGLSQDAAPPHPRRWWGLVVIALAQLMVLLQTTTFNMAMPSVQADMHLPSDGLRTVVGAYALALCGLLLLGGHLADLMGRKRALVIGLAGFAAASVLGGAAGDSATLTGARALQGAFAALLTPSGLSLVSTGFTDPRERARAFGVYAAVIAGGGSLGLFAGGWLIETLSWRWTLYANVPVAVIALIGALTLVHDRADRDGPRFDVLGVLFGSGGLAAAVYGLDQAASNGWAPLALIMLALGTVLLGAFAAWQRSASSSLLSASTIRDRDRVGSFVTMLVAGVGFLALFPLLTFFLQNLLGYSPAGAGTALLPLVGAAVIGATQISGRLLPHTAPRVLIVAGLVAAAVGMLLLTGLKPDSAYVIQLLPGMLLVGLGTGAAFTAVFATATAAVAPRYSGGTAATVTAAQQLGMAVGGALIATMVSSRLSTTRPSSIREQLLDGYTTSLWWAAGSLLLAALLAGLLLTARAPGDSARGPRN
ncbi:MDR family MFS transporter [Streptomyces sp. G-G2]|uniref:MDR family MFS transporter n=1 Tax=Streptomyces sp. G-G2 TaxID=3046201 RepID=UPI0024B99FF2|nr:MDR family MFS transporter [Streptomyces sp. G-G2]MDJ0381159.1 MDR family MFS transporter [Streptomyces sp. G-G2]